MTKDRAREAIRRAQALVRQYVPEGRSLSDELIAERRGISHEEFWHEVENERGRKRAKGKKGTA